MLTDLVVDRLAQLVAEDAQRHLTRHRQQALDGLEDAGPVVLGHPGVEEGLEDLRRHAGHEGVRDLAQVVGEQGEQTDDRLGIETQSDRRRAGPHHRRLEEPHVLVVDPLHEVELTQGVDEGVVTAHARQGGQRVA